MDEIRAKGGDALRVLHTADWHIGQTLNGWSRHEEHKIWFEHLADVIEQQSVDVLIVSGDVYDGINPSGESQKLLYSALRVLKDRCPKLVTIITSGNHDPTVRLEAPAPILASLDVHVIATMRHIDDGGVDYDRHMIRCSIRPVLGGRGFAPFLFFAGR